MKLIILDRDGVINYDSEYYIKSPNEWYPIPGSLEAISKLKQENWTVAVATNQSGISRGFIDHHILHKIHHKMQYMLSSYSAKIDYIIYCPHTDKDRCECRKPLPGMYKNIARYFNHPLDNVPVIGDSRRDLDPAKKVNGRPILVRTGKGSDTENKKLIPAGTQIFDNLHLAVEKLLLTQQ